MFKKRYLLQYWSGASKSWFTTKKFFFRINARMERDLRNGYSRMLVYRVKDEKTGKIEF